MRREVLIQLILAIAFIITWLFMPIYEVSGPGLTIALRPWGFTVSFLGIQYVVIPPTVFAIFLFALSSSLVPIVWRQTRYPLYLSALMAVLSLVMFMDTVLFQWRYMVVKGYVTEPTPTGYIYIQLPHTPSLGLPLYVLIAFVAITLINMVTGAKWLTRAEWSLVNAYVTKGALGTIEDTLRRLNIPYKRVGDELRIGELTIKEARGGIVMTRADTGMVVNEFKGAPEEAITMVISYAVEFALKNKPRVTEYEGE